MLNDYSNLVPPIIVTPTGNALEINEGLDQILINCTATGIPAPNITWRDPSGVDLPNASNDRVLIQDHSEPKMFTEDGVNFVYSITRLLQINDTNDSDSGVYTCVADNGAVKVANNTVTVFVRGKCVAYVLNCTSVMYTLSQTCFTL